ncbi:5-formyltetrahydrofolate cyclo-ligase [Actibacterium lipolyticum]|uniref:5-formyltetrahydrofolate cyclo-ligase n=1 Tax=Actibacterium lipolyticum TaxID=1524263 RepID=A0A238JQY3_9RHOB|nr:5-formyltetrahydrofolate cyclo-ligase [Actibacterium lipolyticum]SMX32587.1 putative 5-formyltetrahydrofolate cyclo-ligase [Actibacterium lipolyticum]
MTDLTEQKTAARKAAFEARKAAHGNGLSAVAAGHLLDVLRPHAGKVISGYMPIRTEIDPLAAMLGMIGQSRVTVPVIQGDGLPLIFREWHPDAKMIDGPFGALVPAEGDFLEPEVLIVPLLAFDRRGYRLGYGGGFYDRSLEALRVARPTIAIGFAYSAQEVKEVPTEPTDQPLDVLVTENGPLELGGGVSV